jgi:hypothetical protein
MSKKLLKKILKELLGNQNDGIRCPYYRCHSYNIEEIDVYNIHIRDAHTFHCLDCGKEWNQLI